MLESRNTHHETRSTTLLSIALTGRCQYWITDIRRRATNRRWSFFFGEHVGKGLGGGRLRTLDMRGCTGMAAYVVATISVNDFLLREVSGNRSDAHLDWRFRFWIRFFDRYSATTRINFLRGFERLVSRFKCPFCHCSPSAHKFQIGFSTKASLTIGQQPEREIQVVYPSNSPRKNKS